MRYDPAMLKRDEPAGDLARVRYGDAEFTVLAPGRFVRCAVSGALIPLDELRYWNVELQEAYRSAAEATARWKALHEKKA
jgi:hypothetical protein